MKGIQEDVSIHTQTDIKHKDLFCGKCFALIQMNHIVKKTEKYECPECGEINVFKDTDKTRIVTIRNQYHGTKRPIVYWARKYRIPVNSCYMSFRKQGVIRGPYERMGQPILMSQREFLAYAVYTRKGRDIVSKMIKKYVLLTKQEINNSI